MLNCNDIIVFFVFLCGFAWNDLHILHFLCYFIFLFNQNKSVEDIFPLLKGIFHFFHEKTHKPIPKREYGEQGFNFYFRHFFTL